MAVGLQRQFPQQGQPIDTVAGADKHPIKTCIDAGAARNAVFSPNRREYILSGDAGLGQLTVRKIDIYLFRLFAQHVDFADFWHCQQFLAHVLHHVAQFRQGKAVTDERVDNAEQIAELIVELRRVNALREQWAYVADLFACLIPDIGNFSWRRRILQRDQNRHFAGFGIAGGVIQPGQFLQLAFDPIGHLPRHLIGRRTWPGQRDDHLLDRKGRVFGTAKRGVGPDATGHDDQHGVKDQRPLCHCPSGYISALLPVRLAGIGSVRPLGAWAGIITPAGNAIVQRIGPCHAVTGRSRSIMSAPAVTTSCPSDNPAPIRTVPSPPKATT